MLNKFKPRVVAWELTRACDLLCLHCRAAGRPKRHPKELLNKEIDNVLDQLVELDPGVVVLTGGDPFWREDLEEIIKKGVNRGLNIALTPSATKKATPQRLKSCADAGVKMMALSLDGENAEAHDKIRAVKGTFDTTISLAKTIRSLGLPLQINTTIMSDNVDSMEKIGALVAEFGANVWSCFFLVSVGRGKRQSELSATQGEQTLNRLAKLAQKLPLAIRTTAAPQYRRILMQQSDNNTKASASLAKAVNNWLAKDGIGVTDGSGICFISHTGDVFPSGFLPIKVGNVRETPLKEIYYENEIMKSLKNRDEYNGKCGSCEFRWPCGGSRARAYANTGDFLGEDPLCPFHS